MSTLSPAAISAISTYHAAIAAAAASGHHGLPVLWSIAADLFEAADAAHAALLDTPYSAADIAAVEAAQAAAALAAAI